MFVGWLIGLGKDWIKDSCLCVKVWMYLCMCNVGVVFIELCVGKKN